jgi:DNA repair exonuclease SbcCD nuclease subunit
MRVLCTGDVHIGRPIAGIPESGTIPRLRTADAWRAIVNLALRERPDLLAISGDIVDERNKYFEAIGPVEDGLQALCEAGIPVVAVAGNHDWDVLPAIARNHPEYLVFLGANQQWQRHTLLRDALPMLHIDGWSFGRASVPDDPLETYRGERSGDAPVLGLVHVDLGATDRRYAPTALASLQRVPVDAWLIGHIHVPRLIEREATPPVLYPGSPFAMDAGEMGAHGVWMLDLELGKPASYRFLPIAPVRFDALAIDISGHTVESDVADQIERDVRRYLEEVLAEPQGASLQLLQLRVSLTGAIPASLGLGETLRGIPERTWRVGNAQAIVTQIEQRTTLDRDLTQIAGSTGIPGTLASLLMSGGAEIREAAKSEIDALRRKRDFSPLADELEISDDEIAAIFDAEAWKLMNALLNQSQVAS